MPVFSTVLNNIVVQNPVGVREPAGSDYVERAVLDYNNVYGNTSNYVLSAGSGAQPGSASLSLPPVFVAPAKGQTPFDKNRVGSALSFLSLQGVLPAVS